MNTLDYATEIEELLDEALNELSGFQFNNLLDQVREIVDSYEYE